jgi:hypothetical protein
MTYSGVEQEMVEEEAVEEEVEPAVSTRLALLDEYVRVGGVGQLGHLSLRRLGCLSHSAFEISRVWY